MALIHPKYFPMTVRNGCLQPIRNIDDYLPEQPTFWWQPPFYVKDGNRYRPKRAEDTKILVIVDRGHMKNIDFDVYLKNSFLR